MKHPTVVYILTIMVIGGTGVAVCGLARGLTAPAAQDTYTIAAMGAAATSTISPIR